MEKIHIVRKSQKRSIGKARDRTGESANHGWALTLALIEYETWGQLELISAGVTERERAGWGRWHHTSRGSCRTHNERKCASNKRAVPRHWKQHDNLIINRRESTKLRSLRRPGLADYASGKWHSCANFKWLKEGPKPHKPWAFCQGSCFIRGFVGFCICTQILHFFPFSFLDCFAHCGD